MRNLGRLVDRAVFYFAKALLCCKLCVLGSNSAQFLSFRLDSAPTESLGSKLPFRLSLQEIGLTMNTDKTTAMVVNPRRKTQSMASQTAGGSIYSQGKQVAFVLCS